MEKEKHIHIGVGAFGLGFVAWLGSRNKLRVVLANRKSGNFKKKCEALQNTKEYKVKYFEGGEDLVSIENFLYYNDTSKDFINEISDVNTALITTSVTKSGLNDIAKYLATGLRKRIYHNHPHVHIIPCENGVQGAELRQLVLDTPEFSSQEALLDSNVTFLSCSVDRICREPYIDNNNQLIVEAEKFAEIVIETNQSKTSKLEILLGNNNGIVIFVDNLKPYQFRKRWLLNGLHLLIAIHAINNNEDYLNVYLNKSKFGLPILRGMQEELKDVFCFLEPNFSSSDLKRYNNVVLRRFKNAPDLVSRIAHRFTGAGCLEAFYSDYFDKITNQVLKFEVSRKITLPNLSHTLALSQKLVSERRYVN
jgi:mannitol-1-phosphate/altronate dehydrogenase